MKYDEHGREVPDPTPVEMPLGWSRPKPLQDLIKDMIRVEMSRQAVAAGFESFEEADDFEVDDSDGDDMLSQYELTPMQEEFRYAKQDASDLDNVDERRHNDRTAEVKPDDEKGNDDVHESGTDDDRKESRRAGEKRDAPRGKGRAAGKRGGGVSEGGGVAE